MYDILKQSKLGYEKVGYQHSPVNMCWKKIYFARPKIFCWIREKESWFKSYHSWRKKGGDNDIPGYDSEIWHPKWELEFCFNRDYQIFREKVEVMCPKFYEKMMAIYLDHPFDITTYDFNDLLPTMQEFFKMLGYDPGLDFFLDLPKINAS